MIRGLPSIAGSFEGRNVRHVVPLGLLAPKVIEAICAGQQSITVSVSYTHLTLPTICSV